MLEGKNREGPKKALLLKQTKNTHRRLFFFFSVRGSEAALPFVSWKPLQLIKTGDE